MYLKKKYNKLEKKRAEVKENCHEMSEPMNKLVVNDNISFHNEPENIVVEETISTYSEATKNSVILSASLMT